MKSNTKLYSIENVPLALAELQITLDCAHAEIRIPLILCTTYR